MSARPEAPVKIKKQHDPYAWDPFLHAPPVQGGNAATMERAQVAVVDPVGSDGHGGSLLLEWTTPEPPFGQLELVPEHDDENAHHPLQHPHPTLHHQQQAQPQHPLQHPHSEYVPATATMAVVLSADSSPENVVSCVDLGLVVDHCKGTIFSSDSQTTRDQWRTCQCLRQKSRDLPGNGKWHGGRRVAGLLNLTAELSKRNPNYHAHREWQQQEQQRAWMAMGSPQPQPRVDALEQAIQGWTPACTIESLRRPLDGDGTYHPDATGRQRITLFQLPWDEEVWDGHGFRRELRAHALHRLVQDLFLAAGLPPPPRAAMTILPPSPSSRPRR